MRAYHVFIQAGVVAQGLLQYLAVAAPKLVWDSSDRGCAPFVRASAVRIRRRQRDASPASRFSPRFAKTFPRRIHRQSPRHNQHAGISLGVMIKNQHSRVFLVNILKHRPYVSITSPARRPSLTDARKSGPRLIDIGGRPLKPTQPRTTICDIAPKGWLIFVSDRTVSSPTVVARVTRTALPEL